jgi:hypothetical protein
VFKGFKALSGEGPLLGHVSSAQTSPDSYSVAKTDSVSPEDINLNFSLLMSASMV